jgi:hypothetical protein
VKEEKEEKEQAKGAAHQGGRRRRKEAKRAEEVKKEEVEEKETKKKEARKEEKAAKKDQRVSRSAVDGAPRRTEEEPRPDASNSGTQQPATRATGLSRDLACVLKHPWLPTGVLHCPGHLSCALCGCIKQQIPVATDELNAVWEGEEGGEDGEGGCEEVARGGEERGRWRRGPRRRRRRRGRMARRRRWLEADEKREAAKKEEAHEGNRRSARSQKLCRLSALKSTFPATMQRKSRESGGGAGRPVRSDRTPIPTPHACPHAPCPEIAKILKKTRPITTV